MSKKIEVRVGNVNWEARIDGEFDGQFVETNHSLRLTKAEVLEVLRRDWSE